MNSFSAALKYAALSIAVLFVAGCSTTLIPEGQYTAPTGEYIIIKGETIFFHIHLKEEHPELFWDRHLDYALYEDGWIIPHTMTSHEFFHMAAFKFYLKGNTIIKKSMRNDDTTTFTLEDYKLQYKR